MNEIMWNTSFTFHSIVHELLMIVCRRLSLLLLLLFFLFTVVIEDDSTENVPKNAMEKAPDDVWNSLKDAEWSLAPHHPPSTKKHFSEYVVFTV